MGETPEHGKENGANGLSSLNKMYQGYFLDYASYVILERAVPTIEDGLKPVQRRILHAMKEMDDGRYHKVANIIGQTMQYHPHGDAAIGDALVNLGQKDLLIDTQGNWGNVLTGDSAAAARYIEARLTKFALEVVFNPQTTRWQLSYDGRKREPVTLPVKFPLLLAQGAEGIAVGLSTKILPHNFIELIEASISILQGKKVQLFPDFPTGGMIDVGDYQGGRRGGRIRARARLEKMDKNLIAVRELPYGVNTGSLIESIIKANDKGKIKIRQVTDNTAQEVEVLVELAAGVSPDVAIDALFAFTDCEVSISPNACVIIDEKPHFLSVEEILERCTFQTKELLRQELLIKEHELLEKWHLASLEKIFIENRIYHDIEACESWEEVLTTIDRALRQYVRCPSDPVTEGDQRLLLMRDFTTDDVIRLTEIKIKRISKYNTFKADELIAALEEELRQVRHDLNHLTDYAIAYFRRLLEKYGKGRERKTKITALDAIQATEVVANNAKLYVNRADGFVGFGMKKDEFVCDCSDIDDVIVFRSDGKFVVTRIAEKTFVGKDILHVAIWKKADERTTYNLIYLDGSSGRSYAKRFNVTAITRDRAYDLTTGEKGSRLFYFSVSPNGEAEVVNVILSPTCKAKKKTFEFDFGELAIKSRSAQGNVVTRFPVRKIALKAVGKSTLGALRLWMDAVSGKLNTDARGIFLGEFDTGDRLLLLYKEGAYEIMEIDQNRRFSPEEVIFIGKYDPELIISAVHFDGHKGWTMVKRFHIETSTLDQRFSFLTDHKDSRLLFASTKPDPRIQYSVKVRNKKIPGELSIAAFIDVKGWKALGNKLSDQKLADVAEIDAPDDNPTKLHAGDTLDFDLDPAAPQGTLFT
ncbi:MAG: hypothetical protein RL386_1718 [Bacteroidota bacterium]|jgi:topoisomerase-4 subunit A